MVFLVAPICGSRIVEAVRWRFATERSSALMTWNAIGGVLEENGRPHD